MMKFRTRSITTTGTRLSSEIDGRAVWARCCRDLIQLHIADLGGEAEMSEAECSLVRRAVRIPTEAGHPFRGEAGQRSDLMSATVPR
jgi:hypothetical protein